MTETKLSDLLGTSICIRIISVYKDITITKLVINFMKDLTGRPIGPTRI
jgi:hypothetical protein